jgi:E3 ubiquitin-protein ligase listerin
MCLMLAIAQFGPEPSRLDRYRNELAAGILGISAAKADTNGLLLLRRLSAVAPDPESDTSFLPQLRAVNFMKVCQQWNSSDEDIDEDVESEMTAVFFHLMPVLQNIPGSHWDFIFDVIESNLEVSF